jgi:hypothetical protein
MIDWLRRADPAFYHKEPYLLRTQAQMARYTDEAQAELRLSLLTADRVLLAATMIVSLAAYAAATGAGALGARGDWLTVWAFAVLAVAGPLALPWWPRRDGTAMWHRALLVLAVGVLFGARMPAHPLFLAPLVGILAASAGVVGVKMIALVWRLRPQVVTWSAFATLLVACAYTFAFDAPAVALRVPVEIAAIAVAYLGVCIMAGRIRRAELMARPPGLLSLPQSIVPLLDRSYDHAIICWFE